MAMHPQTQLTPAAYLLFARAQTEAKHEYLDGEITRMAGASLEHHRIVANLMATLHAQMRWRPCDVCSGARRIHIPATGLSTYPDISALCAEPWLEDNEMDSLLNPSVIIEV